MDFDDLIVELAPPPNRQGKAKDGHEKRFYEGAVMLAYAMHLLETEDTKEIRVHTGREHRVIYIASFAEGVYVLHAFEKNTPTDCQERP